MKLRNNFGNIKSGLQYNITMCSNSVEKEIQRRILAGNRTYFAAISLLRSRLLSRVTKII